MSLVAQGESEQKSAAITWSIIERFKKGIPIISTHNLLGFDKDSFGQIVITLLEFGYAKAKAMVFNLNAAKELPPFLKPGFVPIEK